MYSDLDSKLKILAIVLFAGGALSSIIIGASFWSLSTLTAVLIMILGPIVSWISSWGVYADRKSVV